MARILIIDDDVQYQETLAAELTAAGHLVEIAGDGRDGLERHLRDPADLIVCDLVMPEMDGLELLRELRRGEGSATILVITSGRYVAAEQNAEAAAFLGASRVMMKPFHGRELIAAVNELLGPAAAN